jgi:uncharacterized membrane protein YhaH (DUF805 family)
MSAILRFFFPQQIHRFSYFLRLLACNLTGAFIFGVGSPMERPLVALAYLALAAYGMFFVLLPRLRDVEMSAWWLVVALIPVANILLGIILLFRAPAFHFGSTLTNERAEA